MRRQSAERLHVLEIPLTGLSLLLPSANIAEVVGQSELTPVPFAPPWLIGVVGWRTLAIPIVAPETLLGGRAGAVMPASKIVILYPLAGRRDWEFVGILSASEPRPRAIEGAGLVTAEAADLPNTAYIAAGFKVDGRLLAIPDLEALKKAFYP